MEILIAFLTGAVLAGLIGWLKNKNTATQLFDAQKALGRNEELTRANDELKTKNDNLLAQLQTAQQENSRLTERENSLAKAQQDIEKFIHEFWQKQTEHIRTIQEKSEQSFQTSQAKSQEVFKQITSQSIKEQKEELVQKTSELYAPLKEALEKFSKQMGDLRTESAMRHTSLEKTLEHTLQLNENLSKEAQNLTEALKNNKKQGTWGEIILEDVLNAAGLREGAEFDKQVTLLDEANKRNQPDFIIHLPNKRDLVIDAKMSLNAYVRWANEPDGELRKKYMDEHVDSILKHIDELSEKDYPKLLQNEKLDFTFMFIPVEYAYFVALSAKADLNEYARQHHIVIATASNLFCLLQLVENLWRIERSTETIDQIYKTAQEMHNRVGLFAQRMDDIRKQIVSLQQTYDKANTTLIGGQGIIKSAQKLEQLGIRSARKLPSVAENLLPQEETSSSGAQ